MIAALRIDAHRGFIEEQQTRTVDQSDSQIDAPLHTAGVSLHGIVGPIGHRHVLQHRLDALLEIGAAQPEHLTVEFQILARVESGIQRQILRHDADQPLDLIGLFDDIVTVDAGIAFGGREQAGEHGDGRALARAVRAEQAEDFALLHGETDAFDGHVLAIFFDQVFDFENDRHGAAPFQCHVAN